MKFPKEIGGHSGSGNNDARFIDQYGEPYLTRRRPGTVATTRQGTLEVTTTPPQVATTAAYLSSFFPGSGGLLNVYFASSRTALDVFAITHPMDIDPTGKLSYQAAYNFGQGNGAIHFLEKTSEPQWYWYGEPPTSAARYDKYRLRQFTTRNARDVTELADMGTPDDKIRFDIFTGGLFTTVQTMGGAIVGDALNYRLQTEYAGVTRTDDDLGCKYALYVRRFAGGGGDSTAMEPIRHDRNPFRPIVVRASANVRLALRGWTMSLPNGMTIDTAEPTSSWCVSLDAGGTWADLPVPEYDDQYAEYQARIVAIMTEPGVFPPISSELDKSYLNQNVKCAQLNATQALIFFNCPKIHPDLEEPGTPAGELKGYGDQIMSGIVDLATGSISGVQVVWDSRTDTGITPAAGMGALGGLGAPQRVIYDVLSVPGGVLVTTLFHPYKPDAPGLISFNYDGPRVTQFTSDGTTYTNVHTMPFGGYRTGRIRGKDADTLMCPMWNDGFVGLYTSKDLCATWTLDAGLLTIAMPAPEDAFSYELNPFNTVFALRKAGGKPAFFNPIAPWTLDVRVSHP